MPRNIEIKAKLRSFETQARLVEAFNLDSKETFAQQDTFFKVPAGRLKLREFADGSGELIQYERDDTGGPKESRYAIARIPEPAALKTVLKNALGSLGWFAKSELSIFTVRRVFILMKSMDSAPLSNWKSCLPTAKTYRGE